MPHVHCNTFPVADPTNLLAEIARQPVLYFDDPHAGQVGDTEGIDRLLRLSKVHGKAIRFHVEELGQSDVHWVWLGDHSAMALLSMPGGIQTMYLHLSGLHQAEEESALNYVHKLVHGQFSLGEARPRNDTTSLIAFELNADEKTWHQFAFLSKILHGAFCDICGVPPEELGRRM
jgi:hypothetical protein